MYFGFSIDVPEVLFTSSNFSSKKPLKTWEKLDKKIFEEEEEKKEGGESNVAEIDSKKVRVGLLQHLHIKF